MRLEVVVWLLSVKALLTLFVSAFDLVLSACLLQLAEYHREPADAACPLFISVPPPSNFCFITAWEMSKENIKLRE